MNRNCSVTISLLNKEGPIYLLEERIDDKFVKYTLNNSLSPVLHLTGRDLKITLFLCFSQHVQYLDTQENLFLSNFQGGRPLLTDPQVITTSKYSTKFTAGNISSILESFKQLHKCNHYCQWFSLTSYDDSTDVREMVPRSVESDMDLDTQLTST
ncbi:kinase-like domain-containing protein [Irpex rosettiformis]|uniref:Kinase-like domain-containing protein n=1 Tax=Irpex rosettiformis TaxID=378272 RepID=A0ACB8TPA3_9APHY|nr:kinase-like domain-containing protein [Irpex rosettiformis]